MHSTKRSDSRIESKSLYYRPFSFSRRRRHTTYIGDWSSDVCSSDLIVTRKMPRLVARHRSAPLRAAAFSALQSGTRVPRERDVLERHALLPGSAGNRAALFARPASAGFSPPHGELNSDFSCRGRASVYPPAPKGPALFFSPCL